MNIPIFELERVQSLFENTVDYNLTESGFHPFTLKEFLSEDQMEELSNIVLGYGQTNGSIALRDRISALYDNANRDNVLVTNGSSEANFVACHSLLEAGDEVIMMLPNYMQIWGTALEMNCEVKAFHLKPENNWAPDLDELSSLVSEKTKMIALCNPNNPTGYVLSLNEMTKLVEIASSVDAWLYCDEVYRGAELNGETAPSFIGMHDKIVVTGGLSKAYALPGIRLGWLVGPKDLIADTWSYHDYTSITAGIMSHYLGEIALRPEKRNEILTRNRRMLNENLIAVKGWLDQYGELFQYVPPLGGGMLFIKYDLDINSSELTRWLREEKSVFIVAGDCFGMDHHIRIGIGERKSYILEGLERVREALTERFSL
ncbi:MAG: aminotransferase class I/II-fold pyridoxal phosphate-dependent enzyme [Cyclobacteriaceae bacterium]